MAGREAFAFFFGSLTEKNDRRYKKDEDETAVISRSN